MNEKTKLLVKQLKDRFPGQIHFRKKHIVETAAELNLSQEDYGHHLFSASCRVHKGTYDLSQFISDGAEKIVAVQAAQADLRYVEWGHFDTIKTIVASRVFMPVFITGLSGNGKTSQVEQVCTSLGRELIRFQVSSNTDADDLLGGLRLTHGSTVFQDGPVVTAARKGSILLLDEIDRGNNRLLCLQNVLEGKSFVIPKTGEIITPAAGFNVIATANTKGKGSTAGHFAAATILDEAFLERFPITIDQTYAPKDVEIKIIQNHSVAYGSDMDRKFIENLVFWADTIRKTYDAGGTDETISTRRLCHIAQTYGIMKDKEKAIRLCIARFDKDTCDSFVDIYAKIDPTFAVREK